MKNIENEEKKLRPLRPQEKDFVHQIVYNGLTREEAYAYVHGKQYNADTMPTLKSSAYGMFFRPCVYAYYEECMAEVRKKETAKAIWTKEVATEKLMRLISAAEQDLYGVPEEGVTPKPITMSRVNAIVLPAKELNLMNGYNASNVNVGGGVVVKFEGEDEIPD